MKKFTMYICVGIMFLIVVFLGATSFSLAKYVAKSSWNYYLESRGFYFDSSDLNGSDNVNSNWDGGHVYFNIKNNVNDELITGYDINYKATCRVVGEASDKAECIMNDSGSNTFNGVLSTSSRCVNDKDSVDVSSYEELKCTRDGYTWSNRAASSDLYFDIVSSEEVTGLNVLVEVESTAPYKKKLSSTFILNKGHDLIGSLKLNYKEDELHNRLVITNSYNEDKCVKLSWDSSKLRIDIKKEDFSFTSDNGYINSIEFMIGKRDSLDYLFYKVDNSLVFSNDFFNLIESNGC